MFLILILTFIFSFAVGRYSIHPFDVIKILLSRLIRLDQTWDNNAQTVIFQIRLPRIIAGALIGSALSCAGCVYQGLFKNPMVSPEVLGASNGAGFGAALGIFFSLGYANITVISFFMGLFAVSLAYFISERSRAEKTFSMILSGIMVGSLFSAFISYLKLIADTENTLPAITYWLMGSLASIKIEDVLFLSLPVLIAFIPLFLIRWRINMLTMGEEEALSLGINVKLLKLVIIVCATLMTSASVSVSGIIGWVGLVIPHFARMLVGYDYRYLLLASCMLGATFLLFVDNFARNIATSEIPLGILTSMIGAPMFLYLIYKVGESK
ncbi:MAG: iron ABC transporter permease [Johnsonella sp.]|nr:iron ABC transporter permease [Johnsonella sp.]